MPVRARALVVGLALLPVQAIISLYGQVFWQSHPATVSLYYNAVVTLLGLVALNHLLRAFRPSAALTPGELGLVYVMQALATALFGHDQMHNLVAVVAYPVWHATPDNKWEDLFLSELRGWLTPLDHRALWLFYDAHLPLFATPYWRLWIVPVLSWTLFMVLMGWTFLCLNSLFRRNWTEESKLSFPIVQLPLEMIDTRLRLYRSKAMWIGFGVAALIDLMNGLHHLYPTFPSFLGIRSAAWDLGQQVKNMPWRAIGWTPLNVYPFAVGLAFFIPLDLAFSCWFFYVYWKWVRIGSAAAGWGRIPRAPWVDEQCFGGYLALAMYSLWAVRGWIARAWQSLWQHSGDDAYEPLPYAVALVGAIAGFFGLAAFLTAGGASFTGAAAWLLLYLAISVAVARIRAELGSPVHDLHFMGPEVLLIEAFSPRGFSKGTLVMYSFMFAFTRAHRSHPMPVQIEAMKIASETGVSQRVVAATLMATTLVAAVMGWYVMLSLAARYGQVPTYAGREAFTRLQSWLEGAWRANPRAVAAAGAGWLTTVLLTAMRTRYVWWPFHPAGYAVSGSWSMALFAPSIFVSWLAKSTILRYGGMTSYRPASRFFAGLILGEFVMGMFWASYGIYRHKPMYNFLP